MPIAAKCPGCNAPLQDAPAPGASYQCPNCSGVFHASHVGEPDQIAETAIFDPNAASQFPTLPDYEILEALGKGGRGQVYLAKQLKLDRLVAIKVIRSDLLSDRGAVKRFQREAKAVARLAHPNVVAIFDADEADGIHYLVMEYIDGDDLGSLVRGGAQLPIAQVCDWVRQAALG